MSDIAWIRKTLQEMAEPAYRDFSAALVPGCKNMLGVRLPVLRRLAAQLGRQNCQEFLCAPEEQYFEETMLKGMVIATQPMPLAQRLRLTAGFIPHITSWSVCDSFCNSFRPLPQEKEPLWEFLRPYAAAKEEFAVRFAAVMTLNHYLHKEYLPRALALFESANTGAGYYAAMGVAWAVSMAYVQYPEQTLPLLQNGALEEETRALAIKKICESRKVDEEQRQLMKTLKRGGKEETI